MMDIGGAVLQAHVRLQDPEHPIQDITRGWARAARATRLALFFWNQRFNDGPLLVCEIHRIPSVHVSAGIVPTEL